MGRMAAIPGVQAKGAYGRLAAQDSSDARKLYCRVSKELLTSDDTTPRRCYSRDAGSLTPAL